jgi:hypothetical protein
MASPSKEEILKVQENLNNMITFNKDLEVQNDLKLQNAYALLSQTDNSDLGLSIGLNLLGGCFWEVGGLMGPGGSIAANFLSGLVSNYASTTPPSLNSTYSSLLVRMQNTSIQVNEDLAMYHENTVANWNTTLSGKFSTPFETLSARGTVGDLATITFPTQSDPNYYTILNGCIKAYDQYIWSVLLGRFVITHYIESNPQPWSLPCDTDSIDNGFLQIHKSYYHTWTLEDNVDKHGNHYQTYDREEYNIGTGAGMFSDGALNDAACDYMFHNYSSAIENPDGLFERVDVFTKLNIPKKDDYLNNGFSVSKMFRSSYGKPLVLMNKKTRRSCNFC